MAPKLNARSGRVRHIQESPPGSRIPWWAGVSQAAGAMVVTGAALTVLATAAVLDHSATGGVAGLGRFTEDGQGVAVFGTLIAAGFALTIVLTAGAFAAAGPQRSLALAADCMAKAVLAGAVIFMFTFPDLSQFEGKSLTYRAILYPALGFALPAAHWLRGRRAPFPLLVDLCLTFVLAFDIVSNDLHYYGTWRHWDDFVHFLNSVPAMVVVVAPFLALEARGRIRLGFWGAAFFALTTYTSLHALWEIEEFMFDRYLGTNLQPGGMMEATRNNLSGIAGAVVGVGLLRVWSHAGGLRQALGLETPVAGSAVERSVEA